MTDCRFEEQAIEPTLDGLRTPDGTRLSDQTKGKIMDDGRRIMRGLDGDGAAAAARVVQRHRVVAQGVPAAGGDHGGGQGFLERRVALVLTPAALEQRLTRGDRKSTRLNSSQ